MLNVTQQIGDDWRDRALPGCRARLPVADEKTETEKVTRREQSCGEVEPGMPEEGIVHKLAVVGAMAEVSLANFVEQSGDAIVCCSADGMVQTWNRAAERLFGHAAADMIGTSILKLVEDKAREQGALHLGALMLEGHAARRQLVCLHRDGSSIEVAIGLTPLHDATQRLQLLVITFHDIRRYRRTEDRMQLAAGVFLHASEGIMIIDRDYSIMLVNPAFSRITGYDADRVIGRSSREFVAEWQSPDVFDEVWGAVSANGAWQGEFWGKRRDGGHYCVWVSIGAIPGDQGRPACYCIVFMDITGRKDAEAELRRVNADLESRIALRTAELERVNQELESFSYSVSHDLRAPLRVIDGFSKLVVNSAPQGLDEPTLKNLKRIADGVRQMEGLIHDLLDLARLSRVEMVRQELDLSEMAECELRILRESQQQRQVDIQVQPGLRAKADPGLFRILVRNLLGNAWKFTANNVCARIEVGTVRCDGGEAYFVRDNGVGFDMKYAGKLFAPFQRLHSREEFEGSGIGLSIVQRIVARHGGRVWANAKQGEGATFFFTLG